MINLELLDSIILSDKVVEKFESLYETNVEFRLWLDAVIPEIRQCEKQQQNNPWHKYNVLGHILHSVEEMNKQTAEMELNERRLLAYVMLFHDIGKPATHNVREKDGKMIDSFFNHNIKSEEIARRVLPNLGFSETEVEIIAKLIYKHDIFMFIKDYPTKNRYWRQLTDDLLEEEIQDLNSVGDGETLMSWLVMVGRSDNRAQNEKMTGEALALLDKFDKMIADRNFGANN